MADGELGFLGLTHNPFLQEESKDFFEGGDRKTHLELLRTLSHWSRKIMVVTGSLGVGKTTLFRQVCSTLEPRVRAARINGLLVNNARDVLVSVAQGVGATLPAEASVTAAAEALATYFIGQERQGRFCLILVDDAQLLDSQALEEVLRLVKNSPVRLCLFGESGTVNGVSRAATRNGLEWQEIRLSGYAAADIEKYLSWKLAQAGYRGRLPFNPNQVARLARLSGGLPAELNQLAGALLARLESGRGGESGGRFPIAHGLLVVLLVVVVSLAYLILNRPDDDAPQTAGTSARVTTTLELPEVAEENSASDDGAVAAAEPATEPVGVGEHTPDADDAAPAEVAQPPARTADTTQVAAVSGAATNADVAATAAREPAAVKPTQSSTARPAAAQPALVKPAVAKPAPTKPATVAPPGVSASQVTERVPLATHDADWLLAQTADNYTVQLVSFSEGGRLVAFLDQQRNPGEFAWYPVVRGGKTLYVVTYGQFPNKAAADGAAAALPAEVGKLQPWVRPMRLVHEAVRAAR
ncbi:MAG: AAA family ATPase [Pseudomonadales bacterium]